MYKCQKVLITGVAGFLGYNLAKRLLEDNRIEIIGVDNFSYVDKKHSLDIHKEITLLEGDISERETLKQVPKDIDLIYHFGSPSSIILFKNDLEKCYKETVLGQLNVFEFGKGNNVEKIIYPSSGSNYAGNLHPHNEIVYPKPKNIYAAAKIACEAIAFSYDVFVKSVGVRIFAGYGPGEERKGRFASVLYLFISDILNNKNPLVFGDGTQSRDFVYIDDIVNVILKVSKNDFNGILNVGTGTSTAFNTLISIINDILGKDIPPVYTKKEKGYVENLCADTAKMKEITEITPISIEEGIKRYINYLLRESV